MVTLRDVARAAGVSPATASRALADPARVSPERRRRVVAAAEELGYAPPGARGERTGPGARSDPGATADPGAVGLVVPDLQNPFFAGIAKGVHQRAHREGLAVVVADADEDPRLELEVLRRMAGRVRGVVLCSRMSDRALDALPEDPPTVLVNRESQRLRSVVVDNDGGVRHAVGHLAALGHRRVAYAGGPWGSWSDRARRRALDHAVRTLRDLPERADVDVVHLGHFPPVFAGGVAAADLVPASGATAVLAHNDLIALGILDRLRARGVRVPDDVSVVGIDDIPGATQVSPALTTVAVPLRLLGRTAVDLLLDPGHTVPDAAGTSPGDAATPPRTQVMPVSLVVRGSTGPAHR